MLRRTPRRVAVSARWHAWRRRWGRAKVGGAPLGISAIDVSPTTGLRADASDMRPEEQGRAQRSRIDRTPPTTFEVV